MFSNLIESGSHAADLKRRGRFFIGTIFFYALLLAASGVGSIYAYNARLAEPSDYEVLALMRFPPADSSAPARHEESRPAASRSHINQVATQPEISVETPFHGDRIASETTRESPPNAHIIIGPVEHDAVSIGGPVGPNSGDGPGNATGRDSGPTVSESTEAPAPVFRPTPQPTPAPTPQGPLHLASSVLTGKAISKPAPPYPAIAVAAHVQGPVAVQVLIDEQGRVVNAKATSGSGLLQAAAVQAAYQARFIPTLLGGQPVKVTGVITYNFVLNQ
ncbi:MAG TPA: energy transducer TonB [Pyrinomonadaceae bacterium]|jgi:protein TonB|nr:energy transducer TonB [Pyrinomonadaceae bacterium]